MKYKFLLIIVTECCLEKIRFFCFLKGDANRIKSKHGINVILLNWFQICISNLLMSIMKSVLFYLKLLKKKNNDKVHVLCS